MYMYQNFLALGEVQRREKAIKHDKTSQKIEDKLAQNEIENVKIKTPVEKATALSQLDTVFLPDSTPSSKKMLNSDSGLISASFNPICLICHSRLCTAAFNPQFQNKLTTCAP